MATVAASVLASVCVDDDGKRAVLRAAARRSSLGSVTAGLVPLTSLIALPPPGFPGLQSKAAPAAALSACQAIAVLAAHPALRSALKQSTDGGSGGLVRTLQALSSAAQGTAGGTAYGGALAPSLLRAAKRAEEVVTWLP